MRPATLPALPPAARSFRARSTRPLSFLALLVLGAATLALAAVGGAAARFGAPAPQALPPAAGPGGPILVVASAARPFGRYYAEILRAEGFNTFSVRDLATLSAAQLDSFDVVLLGESALSGAQVTLLTNWVTNGGALVAMRPDKQLAGLLGLSVTPGTLGNRYLRVNTAAAPGAGITGETMQFHGVADVYGLGAASAVATLYSDAVTGTSAPAVSWRAVGGAGGVAAAFTYDLARSVVQTRQGNPAWSAQERDGQPPIRSDDLFYGAAAFDPQPDWVDFGKIAIPQADEQQRLLANMIVKAALHRKPLPRLWYLPRGRNAVVVMTGDDHANNGTAPRFAQYLAQSPPGCSVDDWECVRGSSYIYLNTPLSDSLAAYYEARGFEVGLHVSTFCNTWTPANLDGFYADQLPQFATLFPHVPAPTTNRTHCIAGGDYTTQAVVQANHGIRMDTNYYYWPEAWIQNRPGLFTGSGLAMRFADSTGVLIDCYQLATQMTDESGQSYPAHIDSLLNRALDARGYYGSFCANMHTDAPTSSGSDAIVASCQARGVPVISARQLLTWLDGREATTLTGLTWTANQLHFALAVPAGARNLQAMLPLYSATGTLTSLARDGVPVPRTTRTIKGVAWAFFDAATGNWTAGYTPDATPPAISAVAAAPAPDLTAAITWTTDEPSTSRVDYGTAPGVLNQAVSTGAMVTAHAVTLTGLAASTTYYYRVTSADAFGNTAINPNPPAAPRTFTTPSPPCLNDATAADFGAGSTGGATWVARQGDGEVILRPALVEEFDAAGPGLPAGWGGFPWSVGGAAVQGGGRIVVDGARANTEPPPGVSAPVALDFSATLRAAPFQHAGFGGGNDLTPGEIYNVAPWAMFSTGAAGSQLLARTWSGGTSTDVPLGAGFLGAAHRYRILWGASSVSFWVDDALLSTQAIAIGGAMRPAFSDASVGGPALDLDWLYASPYAASGTFTSRVFDAGAPRCWSSVSWTATLPAGTALSLQTRQGNTPVPDGSWTPFVPVAGNGGSMSGCSRYLQYRVDLATSDPTVTPVLKDVTFNCNVSGAPEEEAPPPATTLGLPTPNPFRALTRMEFRLARPGRVEINVLTVDGRLVRHLVDAALPAGGQAVTWDGRDDAGRETASGLYYARLRTAEGVQSRTVLRIR